MSDTTIISTIGAAVTAGVAIATVVNAWMTRVDGRRMSTAEAWERLAVEYKTDIERLESKLTVEVKEADAERDKRRTVEDALDRARAELRREQEATAIQHTVIEAVVGGKKPE